MYLFRLPDLGEGLAEAKIRQWYIQVGDYITVDTPLLAVETAKAVVDIPSPYTGTISQLFGEPDANIATGAPLVEFKEGTENNEDHKDNNTGLKTTIAADTHPTDAGTVVGVLESSEQPLHTDQDSTQQPYVRATPAAHQLAQQLGIDLNALAKNYINQLITPAIVLTATPHNTGKMNDQSVTTHPKKMIHAQQPQAAYADTSKNINTPLFDANLPLDPMRQMMSKQMTQSHQHVVPVTITDEADVYRWYGQHDISIRLIHALVAACQAVPILNAHFDSEQLCYRLCPVVNLGLAVNTAHGLYVPVIKDAGVQSDQQLRDTINEFKQQAATHNIRKSDLEGATITLSNFGVLSGRFATPIVIPPQVAILGVGKLHQAVVAMDGAFAIHPLLPLSLTVDHRLITGGEAAEFLHTLLQHLTSYL